MFRSAALRSSTRTLLALAAASTLGVGSQAHAVTLTWTGNGADSFFGTADNWDPVQTPTASDDLIFPARTSPPPRTPLFEGNDSARSVLIDNSGGFVWNLPRAGSTSPRSITLGSGGLTLSGGGSTGWGAVTTTISTAQTWDIASGTTLALASGATLAGSGRITKTGGGTVNLASSSGGFSGGWDITAGLVTNAGGATTNIYGTGPVSISGTGELNLNITGGGSVSGGAITLHHGGKLSGRTGIPSTGETGISNIGGAIGVSTVPNTIATIQATHTGENFRLNNAVTGGAGLDNTTILIQGPGQVHLMNGSTAGDAFLGTWKVESGATLRMENANSLGYRGSTTRSRLELNGGTALWAGTASGSTPVNFGNPVVVTASSTMTIDKIAHPTNPTTVANNSGAIGRVLGPLSIGQVTLTVNSSNGVSGGTTPADPVRLGGGATTLTGNATFNVVNNTFHGYQVEYVSAGISDGGNGFGFTKAGTGVMSVTAASSYSGPTKVTGGLLRVTNLGGLGMTSSIEVASGATLNLAAGGANNWSTKASVSGSGMISLTGGTGNTLTLQGSTVSPGTSAGILSVTGNLSFVPDSSLFPTLIIEVIGGDEVPGVDYDRLAVSGTVTGLSNVDLVVDFSSFVSGDTTGDVLTIVTSSTNFVGQQFRSVGFVGGSTADVNYLNGAITLTNVVIPEPSALSLLAIGGMGLLRRRR